MIGQIETLLIPGEDSFPPDSISIDSSVLLESESQTAPDTDGLVWCGQPVSLYVLPHSPKTSRLRPSWRPNSGLAVRVDGLETWSPGSQQTPETPLGTERMDEWEKVSKISTEPQM